MTGPQQAHIATCAFCRIAQGEDPAAEVVGETDAWIAFFPLNPATHGHTLVVPRTHVENLWDTPTNLAQALMVGVVEVGNAVQAALHPEGMNLISSAGSVAEQTVLHLHLHVVPRWRRDGFGRIWPSEASFDDPDLGDAADRVRRAYTNLRGR